MTTHGREMASALLSGRDRPLEPVDRFGEVVFGLIMVLTFTGSLSVATSGHHEVREMLIAALGCNIAWGIVDGVMYVVASLAYRARQARIQEAVGEVEGSTSRALLRSELPELLDEALDDRAVDTLVARVRDRNAPRLAAGITWEDLKGAFGVFLLVTLATIPVALPFIFVPEVHLALRVSNGVALAMLFISGWSLGRASGLRPWAVGGVVTVLGAGLVALTIALGG